LESDEARCRFREKFRLDELTVFESDDWALSVRPVQPVLGALVLSSRHAALDFSQLPPGRGASMVELMARAETAARTAFGAVRLNALCLMMQDPLFHFHLLPRYSEPVDFGDGSWFDSGWPGQPNLADSQASGDVQLLEILRTYASFEWQ
jgi:diadenosine tetraphosphate (Ap4A) HIT family hydrolase